VRPLFNANANVSKRRAGNMPYERLGLKRLAEFNCVASRSRIDCARPTSSEFAIKNSVNDVCGALSLTR
jgi:hypothetical protein